MCRNHGIGTLEKWKGDMMRIWTWVFIDRKEGSGGGGAGRGGGCVRLFVGASEYGQPSSDRNS